MVKDRPRTVLAVLVALPLFAGAGSAGAAEPALAVPIGAGIDFTPRADAAPAATDRPGSGAADAVNLSGRPAVQPAPVPAAPQASAPRTIAGLRGLTTTGALQGTLSAADRPSDEWVSKPLWPGRAAPYFRFNEDERVLGLSFKIRPPPQAPRATSPGS
ncbi:MAG: hypothetical protein AB7O88_19675 [Reyranellaceae bacterium]